MSGSDALRLFHAGAFRDDAGLYRDSLSVLYAAEGGGYMDLCGTGAVVPTYLQDCSGTCGLECGGCGGGRTLYCAVSAGKEERQGGKKQTVSFACCCYP